MQKHLLEMKNISKQFNGVSILKKVNLQVDSGEVHILMGENGAGKSTLMKILSGAYRNEEGDIYLNNKKIIINNPKDAIDNGISIIYQEFNLIPHMSIYENMYMGKEYMKHGLVNHKRAIRESRKWLEMIGLYLDPKTIVETLSIAEQQMVEIAKALTFDLNILILDEPTASLTETETEKLFELICILKKRGVGIIYISHRMKELFQIGDRCTVMRDGQTIKTVLLNETNVDELTYLMVGHRVNLDRKNNSFGTRDIIMSVQHLSCHFPNKKDDFLREISFDVKKGEILGFAGLVGSGRTELAKCIIGAYKRADGKILIEGKELKINSIHESIKNGLVYLSEDRKGEGLSLTHSVAENIVLPNLHLLGHTTISLKKMKLFVSRSVEEMKIKVHSLNQEVETLSGGNQQKIVIAKWLPQHAKIYIFDEPTRGIDIGARAEIYNIMYKILESGSSIILISSDMNELMKMSDRIAMMKDGKLVTILENTEALTPEDVLNYILIGGSIV